MSPSGRFFVDVYSKPDVPPVAQLRDADGKLILALEKADVTRLVAAGWQPPVPITVKARDGVTDLYGLMYKPTTLDPSKKYPIVNHIYPGPQTGSVGGRTFNASRGDAQALAELGFVVVEIDGMGTPWRSKRFHEAYYGNMGDNTLPDQVAGMKELAKRYPWIDIDRVGIYGHSGGGYATADAMFRYPDFFKVGISEAGNHDNRVYEDDWAEKWQGLLEKKADGTTNYDNQANQLQAKNLKGKLLLAHGTMDNNVPPNNYAAGRQRAHQSQQGLRSADAAQPRTRVRQRRLHGSSALGLLREVPARGGAAARVPDALAGGLAPDALGERLTAADQAYQEQHDGNHEQHVNERANGVGPDHDEQPGNQQNHRQCVQHLNPPISGIARNGATPASSAVAEAEWMNLPSKVVRDKEIHNWYGLNQFKRCILIGRLRV